MDADSFLISLNEVFEGNGPKIFFETKKMKSIGVNRLMIRKARKLPNRIRFMLFFFFKGQPSLHYKAIHPSIFKAALYLSIIESAESITSLAPSEVYLPVFEALSVI